MIIEIGYGHGPSQVAEDCAVARCQRRMAFANTTYCNTTLHACTDGIFIINVIYKLV